MSKLPKLKVKRTFGYPLEETRDFEQAKYFPFCQHIIIMVENQVINSYEELIQLASQDSYQDKEFLEVTILPLIGGG